MKKMGWDVGEGVECGVGAREIHPGSTKREGYTFVADLVQNCIFASPILIFGMSRITHV